MIGVAIMHRETTADAARNEEAAQTMAEYAVVLSVITLAILLTFQLIGNSAGNVIDRVAGVIGSGG
jgi:Flp pilus assembly pilin Flp